MYIYIIIYQNYINIIFLWKEKKIAKKKQEKKLIKFL